MTKTTECPHCKKTFTPGVNGMWTPQGCDACLGIVRDKTGAPWLPREVEHLVVDPKTGRPTTITREQAFPQAAFKTAFKPKGESRG